MGLRPLSRRRTAALLALIDDSGLVLPVMDYRVRRRRGDRAVLCAAAPAFSQNVLARLARGLNLARQLAWQQRRLPMCSHGQNSSGLSAYWAWDFQANGG